MAYRVPQNERNRLEGTFEEIIGDSPALKSVLVEVERVAPTDSTVLVTGETGTGKELVARAIHKRSLRATRAFVSVNCAAIARTLFASSLSPIASSTGTMSRNAAQDDASAVKE